MNNLEVLTNGLKTFELQGKLAEAFEGFTIGDFEKFLREFHFENCIDVDASDGFYYEVAREFYRWLYAFKTFTSSGAESQFTIEQIDHLTGEVFEDECPKIAMGLDGYLVDVRREENIVVAGCSFERIYDWCASRADDYDFKALMKSWKK